MRTTLTAFVPAHKQTSEEHKPGQVVFSPKSGANTTTNPLGFVLQPSEQTLAEYVARVRARDAFDQVAAEKKLTFEQWWAYVMPEDDFDMSRWKDQFKECWKAAQDAQVLESNHALRRL
jgi:hypothetical protein